MVVIGIDPHKRTHTAVAVDEVGRKLGQVTVASTPEGWLRLWAWAGGFGPDRRWAVEDGRGVAGRLVRTLIGHGASVVWVPPKLMAQSRASARTRGKSDSIDALAIARAALREPDLPAAHLDEVAADLRLLTDRREQLVKWRTQTINQLRWHLHDLDPGAGRLNSARQLDRLTAGLEALPASVRRDLALELVGEIRRLREQIRRLDKQLGELVVPLAPTLLAIVGVNVVTAAKIIGEVAGISRFRSAAAFAMHAGAAPIPVWSSNRPQVRLNRGGNRQLNACLHRIVIAQLSHKPEARAWRERWTQRRPNATGKAALRALKRHLADVVYHALLTDHRRQLPATA
ncbi:transposase [Pseudonocardia hierapolitana]|uniref:Transposase n=1 Tax=Pseudonocardia hierapolitana TaxID=1128676 RepID=A0A561SX08_9PSEU|nr:IS110 family transposase [Pseudonocardia hierapolitana]TWF79394.1 transposase [Pseudonocardia hierapolitana]